MLGAPRDKPAVIWQVRAGDDHRHVPKVRDVPRLLHEAGWREVRRRGNHRQLQHPHRPGTVTVAGEPSYMLPVATYRSILRQSGLDRESEG